MKWLTMAAVVLVFLFGVALLMVNSEKQLAAITGEMQFYEGRRDALQKEVRDFQEALNNRVAQELERKWEELMKKEGELKGKYGERLSLEKECTELGAQRDRLDGEIKTIRDRLGELVVQTNSLAVEIDSMHKEHDAIRAKVAADTEARDKAMALRKAEEARYLERKNAADAMSRAADDAEWRREQTESSVVVATNTLKALEMRIADARRETGKEIAELEKRISDAKKDAAAAMAGVDAERARLEALGDEIAKLEARRDELVHVERRLAEAKEGLFKEQENLANAKKGVDAVVAKAEAERARLKALGDEVAKLEVRHDELADVERRLAKVKEDLSMEEKKLANVRAMISERRIMEQIDGIREDVLRKLVVFKDGLEDLEKKFEGVEREQKPEVKEGKTE